MKKLLPIFLLLQFLSNNAFAEELIKIPSLFTHYYHHSNEHHDTDDFIDYLSDHYLHHDNETHHAEENDCNLPFKHCDNCCVSSHAPLIASVPVFNNVFSNIVIVSTKKYTFQNEKIKSTCSPPIWQPPKIN